MWTITTMVGLQNSLSVDEEMLHNVVFFTTFCSSWGMKVFKVAQEYLSIAATSTSWPNWNA